MITFDSNIAKQADQFNASINETGKYIGIITRAEKLLSEKGTQGLGLSFKSDSGETADYLDLYTINAKGEALPSMKTVQAILGCLQLREAKDGKININKYNKDNRKREDVVVSGYPDMMEKRIGLLLQKELSTNIKNGADVERMIVAGVFQADTELTISEILARKTTPETLEKMVQQLMARPVRDSRKRGAQEQQDSYQPASGGSFDSIGDDIPFTYINRKLSMVI